MKKFVAILAAVAATNVALAENIENGELLATEGVGNTVMGTNLTTDGDSNVNLGIHNMVAGKVSAAIGHNAIVEGNMSIAAGHHAQAGGSMATAIGSEATAMESATAVGKGTIAEGKASTAVGAHAYAKDGSTVAVGHHANALGGQSVALGAATVAKGDQSTALGNGAQANERFTTAVGKNAVAENQHDVALGAFSKTTKAVGTATAKVNDVTYGTFAGHRPVAEASFGSKGNERTITNVAAGRIEAASTDAVNGSQVFAVANKVGDNAKAIEAVKEDVAVNANQISTNTQAITNLNQTVEQHNQWNVAQDEAIDELRGTQGVHTEQINNLQQLVKGVSTDNENLRKEVHDMRRESRAGVAGAMAIAGIPQPHAPGQVAIGAGAGYFRHEGAVAAGLSRISHSGKWVTKGAVSFDTRKHIGAAVGVSYVFGKIAQPVAPAPVVIKEVVREVIVREPQEAPKAVKIRG